MTHLMAFLASFVAVLVALVIFSFLSRNPASPLAGKI